MAKYPRGAHIKRVAAAIAVALAAAACSVGDAGGGGAANDADGVVEMVMAPDPVWDWLSDQGIKQKMEEKAGVQIVTSSSWDEFGVYAGGHADVISTATYEVPELQKATGEKQTIFGKYNADRSIVAVGPDSQAQNLCDLKGEKIATYTAVSITLIWGMFAKEMCGTDLRPGGGDYDVIVTDIQNLSALVARGDVAACLCIPEFASPDLMSGSIKPIYDGKSAAQVYQENFGSSQGAATHPMTNVFVAREAWVDKNPKEAEFLIALWQRGLDEWHKHSEEMISEYPEHFAVSNPEQEAFINDWLQNNYDWFDESAYLDETWVKEETGVFELMKKDGFMDEEAETPVFTVFDPDPES